MNDTALSAVQWMTLLSLELEFLYYKLIVYFNPYTLYSFFHLNIQ